MLGLGRERLQGWRGRTEARHFMDGGSANGFGEGPKGLGQDT